MHFLDALSGSPIEICTSFVVFYGEKNLPKLTNGYLRCNKTPTQRSLLR